VFERVVFDAAEPGRNGLPPAPERGYRFLVVGESGALWPIPRREMVELHEASYDWTAHTAIRRVQPVERRDASPKREPLVWTDNDAIWNQLICERLAAEAPAHEADGAARALSLELVHVDDAPAHQTSFDSRSRASSRLANAWRSFSPLTGSS
jgi:hypothetical protein